MPENSTDSYVQPKYSAYLSKTSSKSIKSASSPNKKAKFSWFIQKKYLLLSVFNMKAYGKRMN